VELVLRYRGPLPSTTDRNKHLRIKHSMRKKFHNQLVYHWKHDNYLSNYFPSDAVLAEMVTATDPNRRDCAWFKCVLGRFQFLPLVINSPNFRLTCELDIRFARRDIPGNIVHGGDLDNRIKTLFDALRMPALDALHEFPSDAEPVYGETPFLCLLEDDRLITKFSVASENC
jgi:hypothetical protein